ncbi:MAG: phosphoribosyl-AMP cyclohydrolase [Bordetella sp.]|nr:MAG: phosphoribosyl-AMP cyclohydrolase [Bordetella sp.]
MILSEKFLWIKEVCFNNDGLVPVIVQDYENNKILMMAWMNQESLIKTITTGKAVYWSRSRKNLWEKGEKSGNFQIVKGLYLDCDGDTLLLIVIQYGKIACHTGHSSCFFRKLNKKLNSETKSWIYVEPVLKKPEKIYK